MSDPGTAPSWQSMAAPVSATPPPAPQEQQPDNWQAMAAPVGTPKEPDETDAHDLVANAPGGHVAQNPFDAFMAGVHMSASGLAISAAMGHAKPDYTIPKNAGWAMQLAHDAGGLADVPLMVAGGLAGAAAGSETGPGAAATAGAASFAVPQAVRETVMDYYDRGDIHTAGEALGMVAKNAWNITKAAAAGMIGGKIGEAAEVGAKALGASGIAAHVANAEGFVTSATAAQSLIDGHMPDTHDMTRAAVEGLGLGVAGYAMGGLPRVQEGAGDAAENLAKTYRQTGIRPEVQVHMAKGDPALMDETLARDVNGNPSTPHFNAQRPEEFQPYAGKLLSPQEISTKAEKLLPTVRALEDSGDDAISPKGAVGRFQIEPGTARQYGFDPEKLMDPQYNEAVARHVVGDLLKRFNGDEQAALVAYNAGPTVAWRWLRGGRDMSILPHETQAYLARSGIGAPAEDVSGITQVPETKIEKNSQEPITFGGMSAAEHLERHRAVIGSEPTQNAAKWSDFSRQWVSELAAARGVDKELLRRNLLQPKETNVEDMMRMTYGSEHVASHFTTKGTIDLRTGEQGEPLMKIVHDLHAMGGRDALDEFDRYRLAQRTIEKAKQGIDMGVFKGGLAEAQAVAQDAHFAKYAPFNDRLQTWKNSVLKYAVDSGALTPESAKAMQAANLSHVSIRRIMGDDAAFTQKRGSSRSFRARNPIARMEGDDGSHKIVAPLIADVDNAARIIQFADRARAGQFLADKAAKMPDLFKKVPLEESAAPSGLLKDYGLSEAEGKAFGPMITSAKGGGNTFVTFDNGVPTKWEAKDPNVAALMRGADSKPEADALTNALSTFAKLKRSGLVWSPDFGWRVAFRHTMAAYINSPISPTPYLTMMRGLFDVVGKGDAYWDFARNGGLGATMTEMDRNTINENIEKLYAEPLHGMDKLWNTMKHPLHFAQAINEALSNANRVGTYKAALRQGYEPIKAAAEANKASIDYRERATGAAANLMAKQVPFMRADLLGWQQAHEAWTNRPMQTFAKAAVGVVLPTVAMYALNRAADAMLPEDQKYKNIPRFYRDNFLITPPINGVRFRVAQPFIAGPLFGTITNRFLEAELDKDPHAFDGMIKDLAHSLPPSIMPAFAGAPLEAMTNTNFFTGYKLIPDSLSQLTADQQYTPNTTEVSRKLSEVLGTHRGIGIANVSPIVLDNYAREWGGTLGIDALKVLGAADFKTDTKPFDISNLPFLQSFVVRNPGMSAQPIDDFYTAATPFVQRYEDALKEKMRAGEVTPEALQDAEASDPVMKTINAVKHALNVQRTVINYIDDNPKMAADEKRQFEEQIYRDAIALSHFGMSVIEKNPPSQAEAMALQQKLSGDIEATGYGVPQ